MYKPGTWKITSKLNDLRTAEEEEKKEHVADDNSTHCLNMWSVFDIRN